MSVNADREQEILQIVSSDRCGRSLPQLCSAGMFHNAADLLDASKRSAIVTGFYVPRAGAPETDGPPGSAVLARALIRLGKEAVIVTDRLNFSAVSACCRVIGADQPEVAEDACGVMALNPDLLVFIERLGSSRDGRYYNMMGDDISDFTPPLDAAADKAIAKGIPVLAVGDGGNEAGMACLMPEMASLLPGFRDCFSAVGATVAVPVDVSNWGGYALACMLSCRHGRWFGHSPEEERAMIEAMVEAGAVDGVSAKSEPSVDGLGVAEHMKVVERLKEIYKNFSMGKDKN